MIDLCKARLVHRSSYDKLESQCLYNLTPLAEHVYISLNKNHKKLCISSETCLLDNLLGHLRTLLITFIISSNIWTITHTHTHILMLESPYVALQCPCWGRGWLPHSWNKEWRVCIIPRPTPYLQSLRPKKGYTHKLIAKMYSQVFTQVGKKW